MLTDSRITRLPDFYAKSKESNNNKLLSICGEQHLTLKNDLYEVFESLDIYKAIGNTLDRYGQIYGVSRGGLDDDKYRIRILLKISQIVAGCDFNSIINSISVITEIGKENIRIENSSLPARINIVNMPYSELVEKGIDADFLVEIVSKLLPICIEVGGVYVDGTFEFGESEIDYDANKGFGNEEQNIGGYFGYIKLL